MQFSTFISLLYLFKFHLSVRFCYRLQFLALYGIVRSFILYTLFICLNIFTVLLKILFRLCTRRLFQY